MAKFRKKPPEVDAWVWPDKNIPESVPVSVMDLGGDKICLRCRKPYKGVHGYFSGRLESYHPSVCPSEVIVREVKDGEFSYRIYKPEVFEAIYEPLVSG